MKSFVFLSLILSAAFFSQAQARYVIDLGARQDSLYEVAVMSKEFANPPGYPGYTYARHEIINSGANDVSNRLGLLLPAKSTTQYVDSILVIFRKGADSARIIYTERNDIVRKGRSATLSVLNLFSKKENRVKQDEPSEEWNYLEQQGSIHAGSLKATFFYCTQPRKSSSGFNWLRLAGDTLVLKPADYLKEKGNGSLKKSSKKLYNSWKLMKGEQCIGIIDNQAEPANVYLHKQLTVTEKLLLAAYFYTCNRHIH